MSLGGLFIIATLVEPTARGWKRVGYKVLKYPANQYKLLSEETIRNTKLELNNAVFVDNKLVGTQGNLDRYTALNVVDGKSINGDKLVILGKDTDGNFISVSNPSLEDASQLVNTESESMLLHRLKFSYYDLGSGKRGDKVANAKYIVQDKNESVRPIKGSFEIISQCPVFLEKIFDLTKTQNANYSAKWRVRIVKENERYGVNYQLINTTKPLIEFYDCTAKIKAFPIGQFVCSYYVSDFIKNEKDIRNLMLHQEIPQWSLTKESYKVILEWLKKEGY